MNKVGREEQNAQVEFFALPVHVYSIPAIWHPACMKEKRSLRKIKDWE
jgi:hypothetical protein